MQLESGSAETYRRLGVVPRGKSRRHIITTGRDPSLTGRDASAAERRAAMRGMKDGGVNAPARRSNIIMTSFSTSRRISGRHVRDVTQSPTAAEQFTARLQCQMSHGRHQSLPPE